MTRELEGQVALVTGAGRGIGASTAMLLAEAGAEIVAVDIAAPEATVTAILAAGGEARGLACNVSDSEVVDALFAGINRLDIVVNAAGILREMPVSEMTPDVFDNVIGVNLRGSFLIAQGAARLMIPRKAGRIVLVASELAYPGRAGYAAYCASKAGVLGFARSIARELAPHILVNTVAPGPVDTPMLGLDNMSQEWIDKETDIPLGRVGRPREIAATIRFLCGPDATFFTGQTISPNGGAVMF